MLLVKKSTLECLIYENLITYIMLPETFLAINYEFSVSRNISFSVCRKNYSEYLITVKSSKANSIKKIF